MTAQVSGEKLRAFVDMLRFEHGCKHSEILEILRKKYGWSRPESEERLYNLDIVYGGSHL